MGRTRKVFPPRDNYLNHGMNSTPTMRPEDKIYERRVNADYGHFDVRIDLEKIEAKIYFTVYDGNDFGETICVKTIFYKNVDEIHRIINSHYMYGFSLWDLQSYAADFIETLTSEIRKRDNYVKANLPPNNSAPLRKMRNGKRYLIHCHMYEQKCQSIRHDHVHAVTFWITPAEKNMTDKILYQETLKCEEVYLAPERYQNLQDNIDVYLMESFL